MHKLSTAILTTVVMVVFLFAAVLWGAHKGWSQERTEVVGSLSGLEEMLRARQEVAANILHVAARHMAGSEAAVTALKEDLDSLKRETALGARSRANARLERDAKALLSALSELPSVQGDERDSMYVRSLLPQALEQSARLTEEAAYNEMAQSFNRRRNGSISGRIAGWLGVNDAELFVQEATP